MNDEDENAKEIYDFFKGSGLTSEFFDLTKKIVFKLCMLYVLFFLGRTQKIHHK